MQYAETTGLELESVYPYAGVDQTCAATSAQGKVKVTSVKTVTPNSAD